jgi:hypothetical protein
MALPVGIAPTTRRFVTGRSDLLSYGSFRKWCAEVVLPRLSLQCQCGDLLLIYRRVMPRLLRGNECAGWICTTNLTIQSRALRWLSYRANWRNKMEPAIGAAPIWARLQDECITALPSRRKESVHCANADPLSPCGIGTKSKTRYMGSMEERTNANFTAHPWKSLLLVYRRIDVRFQVSWWRRRSFVHELPEVEIADALRSFKAFPPLAAELSNGEALVTYETVFIGDPIRSVTLDVDYGYCLSPDDIRNELDTYAPAGKYDSVFVFWPQQDLTSGTQIPSRGWGFGAGPSAFTNEATFAVVGNAPSWAWSAKCGCTNGCTVCARFSSNAVFKCRNMMPMPAEVTDTYSANQPAGPHSTGI